eukprot:jgi/Antlo1/2141/1312
MRWQMTAKKAPAHAASISADKRAVCADVLAVAVSSAANCCARCVAANAAKSSVPLFPSYRETETKGGCKVKITESNNPGINLRTMKHRMETEVIMEDLIKILWYEIRAHAYTMVLEA